MAEFQISGRTSETLGRGSWYSSRVWVWISRLVLKSSAEVLGIRYPNEGFIKFWILNWLGRRKLILSIYINRLLHRVWYLKFRCPAAHLKLSAKGLGIRSRIWAWISRLAWKSSADVLWLDIGFQKPRRRIWGLVYKSRLKLSAGYQDPLPGV